MARQTGIIGIQGTVGGLVFSKNGNISQKPASDKAAFASAQSRARTRENAAEFGLAAKYSKRLSGFGQGWGIDYGGHAWS